MYTYAGRIPNSTTLPHRTAEAMAADEEAIMAFVEQEQAAQGRDELSFLDCVEQSPPAAESPTPERQHTPEERDERELGPPVSPEDEHPTPPLTPTQLEEATQGDETPVTQPEPDAAAREKARYDDAQSSAERVVGMPVIKEHTVVAAVREGRQCL